MDFITLTVHREKAPYEIGILCFCASYTLKCVFEFKVVNISLSIFWNAG